MKKLILLTLFLYGLVLSAYAQNDCRYYNKLITEGNTAFARGDYPQALNKYQAAMINCPTRVAEVQPKIQQVFQKIQGLRQEAETAKKEAEQEKNRALALLEEIAARNLQQAEQNIYQANWEAAYDYLKGVNTRQPQLLALQKQYLMRLIGWELYALAPQDWATQSGLRFLRSEAGRLKVDFSNTNSSFAQAIRAAQQQPNRLAARRYLLRQLRQSLGADLVREASNLFTHQKPYPFTFRASDFEPKPEGYEEEYRPLAAKEVENAPPSNSYQPKQNYNRLVMQAYEAGDYRQAYAYQQKALAEDSSNYNLWFNLSFFALYNDAPKVAIKAARQTLVIDSSRLSVETNLALGYLLDNQWGAAKKIYKKWQGKTFPDTQEECNPIFLKDIADLEKAGVSHKNFKKVKKLLGSPEEKSKPRSP